MLLLLPLTLMSMFTPFAVRLLLVSVAFGGRIVSYVYGVSTVGNVLGTLVTTFVLVPEFGSRALTMIFAARHHRLRHRHDAVRPVPARGGRVRARRLALALLLLASAGARRARGGRIGGLSGGADVARRPHLLHRDGRRPRDHHRERRHPRVLAPAGLRTDPDRAVRAHRLRGRLSSRPGDGRGLGRGRDRTQIQHQPGRPAAAGSQRRGERRAGRGVFFRRRPVRSAARRRPAASITSAPWA